ncbi:MAG: hypothetical protein KC653_02905 [Candidatus Andersenbacteria bacterium]|nr:hypothetical protein [Candidatus Andersenbacteria bacterium]
MVKKVKIDSENHPDKWKVVGSPKTPPIWLNSCKPFTVVGHTTHWKQAVTVVDKGLLKANLVYDESTLRAHRIQVVFLSPNEWMVGYRYGNVKFDYSWPELLNGKTAYWVETAMYEIPAPRILLTTRDLTEDPYWGPRLYNPSNKNGPWWHDTDKDVHYFNNNYCLEFMIEDDILLSDAKKIESVERHNKYCCLNRNDPQSCPDLGKGVAYGASRFLAGLIGNRIATRCNIVVDDSGELLEPSQVIKMGWAHLVDELAQKFDSVSGAVKSSDKQCETYARTLLRAFSEGWDDDLTEIGSLFSSREELLLSCKNTIERTLHQDGEFELPNSEVELQVLRQTV